MMVDPAGNLYYDTGSPQLGIYMVSNGLIFQGSPAAIDTRISQAKLNELNRDKVELLASLLKRYCNFLVTVQVA